MAGQIILVGIMGWLVCYATYYGIHRRQIVPVLASAAATMTALLIAKCLPVAWQMDDMLWHLFWFGSSFCGMNNNRWVGFRSLGVVWVLYATVFWLLHLHMPWPGGSLGSMAVLAAVSWILFSKLFNRIKHHVKHRA